MSVQDATSLCCVHHAALQGHFLPQDQRRVALWLRCHNSQLIPQVTDGEVNQACCVS
jgi:hypothetical protein